MSRDASDMVLSDGALNYNMGENHTNDIVHVNRVCMGGDWYTFPSHFFLPETHLKSALRKTKPNEMELDSAVKINETHVRYNSKPMRNVFQGRNGANSNQSPQASTTLRFQLEYILDNFHGQLPKHYRSIDISNLKFATNFNLNYPTDMNYFLLLCKEIWNGLLEKFQMVLSSKNLKSLSIPFFLPNHPFVGTYLGQGFNDRNKEDPAAYMDIKQCDYIVNTVQSSVKSILSVKNQGGLGKQNEVELEQLLKVNKVDFNQVPPVSTYMLVNRLKQLGFKVETSPHAHTGNSTMSSDCEEHMVYDDVLYIETIDSMNSPSHARAFYIPYISSMNAKHEVHVFKKRK